MRDAWRQAILRALRGMGASREHGDREPLAPVGDGERAVEVRMDLDARPGVAAARRAWAQLEDAPIVQDGVIVLDRAQVFKTADAVQVRRGRAPRRLGMGWGMGEAGVVAWEKPIEDPLRLRERVRLGETEFADEAILKGAEEPFHAALALRRLGRDPANAQFLERPSDLGGLHRPVELVRQRQWEAGVPAKDPMAIRVGGGGDPMATEDLAEQEEVAVGIFLRAKDAAEDPSSRVVDRPMEDEAGTAVLQPGMVTAVHLDQEAGLGHGLTPTAVARWAVAAGSGNPVGPEEPLHRRAGDVHAFPFRQELGEVAIVAAGIRGARQGQGPGAESIGESAGRRPAPIAMSESGEPSFPKAGKEPFHMATGYAQQPGGLRGRKTAMLDLEKDLDPLLLCLGQDDRLLVHGSRVTESLSSFGVTNSLSSYTETSRP